MGSLSDYSENVVVEHIIGENAYTSVATVYLALSSTDPLDTGAGITEPVGNNYSRTAITFGAASTRRVTQSGDVTFGQASGSWGAALAYWAIYDASTSGNMLAHGALGTSKSVVNGNTPTVPSTDVWIEITASTGLSDYAANGFLDRMFRNQAFTVSATYLALTTAPVSDSNTGSTITEPSGGSYARLLINEPSGGAPQWTSAGTGNATSNNEAWSLAAATASWTTVVAAAICDASSAGNLLMYDNGITDQAVGDGDTCRFPTGDFDFAQST